MVTGAIAARARVVEARGAQGPVVLDRISRCGSHAHTIHAETLELRPSVADPIIRPGVAALGSVRGATGEIPDVGVAQVRAEQQRPGSAGL
eukprot:4556179-Pyramimonas_sp.AAC.1